jgi:hypothetical protein
MDKDGIYLSPLSILKFECQEYTESYGEHRTLYYVRIISKEQAYGASQKEYKVCFNMTEKGFQVKKEIDDLVNRLIDIIKHPITCGVVLKLTPDKNNYGYNYNLEII